MSVYRSGGLVYVGVDIYVGDVGNPYDYRLSEIYEMTELPHEWDVVDLTSHDSSLPQHGHTRTAKPGLAVQQQLTFKGIWMDEDLYTFRIHDYLQDTYLERTAKEWDIGYSFASVQTGILDYRGVGYIMQYVLNGDLGDKFTYTCQLLFEGELQQVTTSREEYERRRMGVRNVSKSEKKQPIISAELKKKSDAEEKSKI